MSYSAAEWGGGIYVLYDQGATINGNTVTSNTADYGGGLHLRDSVAILSDNTVASNAAGYGGGVYLYESAAALNANRVISNAADYGGGVRVEYSPVTFTGNIVLSNTASQRGGGLSLFTSSATMHRNSLSHNTVFAPFARGGGLEVSNSNAALDASFILYNLADYGGGIYAESSDITSVNGVIADNRATDAGNGLFLVASSTRMSYMTIARNGDEGSGVYVGNATANLTNTILVSHAIGIYVLNFGTATMEATLWGDGAWANQTDWIGAILTGTRNYKGDPAFIDPDAGDYHINPNSAAINKGVNSQVGLDIDGEPRFYQYSDLGADEYWPPGAIKSIYLPIALRQIP